MSSQVSAIPISSISKSDDDINRRSANFQPSVWGDHFLSFPFDDLMMDANKDMEQKTQKEELRRILVQNLGSFSEKLELIDAIQRLGVSYHFEAEINTILEKIEKSQNFIDEDNENVLHTTSLMFRLLRQHGYQTTSDLFKRFKDSQENFKGSIINDARGMLSLYEATHLRIHGEHILDEALDFTATRLVSIATTVNPVLGAQITHALRQSIHKGIPRLEARHYFSIYEQEASHDDVLLTFAKLDFNMLQKLHQKELAAITKWWKELNFSRKLPFARDRVVEGYFWILAVYPEPQYAMARRALTKVIAIASVIDDIYDVHGTMEELELFTNGIERWDTNYIDRLPKYMRYCYEALLDTYEEIEKELAKQGRPHWVHHAKEAMKKLVEAYFAEAKWFNKSYTPSLEEYLDVALVSCGYHMLTVSSFVMMGDVATEEALQWLSAGPNVLKALSVICRLMDDIVTHKDEQERGDVASAVECYMNEYDVSAEEACNELGKLVTNGWKDINEAFQRPTEVPIPLLTRILNLARVMDVFYKDGDQYTNSNGVMKSYITSLLIDAVPL